MNLVFFGPSGSGKDTQAELLESALNFERVSTGDLIRDLCDGTKGIHESIKVALNNGFLSNKFVYGSLEMYLIHKKFPNIIFSGAVRNLRQVELMDNLLLKLNQKLDLAVLFELSDEESTRRIMGRLYCSNCQSNFHKSFNPPKIQGLCDNCDSDLTQRADDNEESVKKRLADFHKSDDKIINRYEERGMLVRLDASKSIEEVHTELLALLKARI